MLEKKQQKFYTILQPMINCYPSIRCSYKTGFQKNLLLIWFECESYSPSRAAVVECADISEPLENLLLHLKTLSFKTSLLKLHTIP